MVRRGRWIDEHSRLVDEYSDVLHEIGSRSDSLNPQARGAAVAVYARTRLEVGPEVDLLEPSVRQAGQWRDMVLEPIETSVPTLRLTG